MRDTGERAALGVDTQALQYLAEYSVYKGMEFIKRNSKYSDSLEDNIIGFLGDESLLKNINQQSRIILIARGFDAALFSTKPLSLIFTEVSSNKVARFPPALIPEIIKRIVL